MVASSSSSQVRTHERSKLCFALLQLARIQFPDSVQQMRKIYQMPNDKDWEYSILTCPKNNNLKENLKLFIRKDMMRNMKDAIQHIVSNISQCNKHGSYITISNGPHRIAAEIIESHDDFMSRRHGIFIVHSRMFQITLRQKGIVTEKIRFYFKEAPTIVFQRFYGADDFEKLGYEFQVPTVVDNGRVRYVNRITDFLTDLYQNLGNSVRVTRYDQEDPMFKSLLGKTACHFESDLFSRMNAPQDFGAFLSTALTNYANRLRSTTQYLFLRRYPDIHYLALTKPHMRINLPQQTYSRPLQQQTYPQHQQSYQPQSQQQHQQHQG